MRIGVLLLLLCTGLRVIPQAPSRYFERLTVQHGLSHNKVNCIIQDQRGFIWMGTDDGLSRYDGQRFLQFRNKSGDSSSLSGNIVTDLLEDKQGRIWIATADGGISRYDYRLPPQRQFKQYRHQQNNPRSIPVNAVNTLLEDQQGYLWLGTSGKGVLRFDKTTERFDDITHGGKTILDLALDHNGSIWVGRQGGGIMKIDSRTLKSTEDPRYMDLYAKLPHVTVTAFYPDKDGSMWFGSWDKVLYRQNIRSSAKTVYRQAGAEGFRDDEVICFAGDKDGRLWIGGKTGGLQVYDPASNRFYQYPSDPAQEGTLGDNTINSIFIDKSGGLWLGTNRGVSFSNAGKQQFVQVFLSQKSTVPLTLYDFHETPSGEVWMGTSAGLYIRRADGSIVHRPLSYGGRPLHVTCFFSDGPGNLYLGTDYSLFRYDAAKNTLALLPNTGKDGVMRRLIESRVVSVVKHKIDGRPVLLVSPYGHFLAYYDLEKKEWVSRLDQRNIVARFGLKDNLVRKLHPSAGGTVYLATAKAGLAAWQPQQQAKVQYLNAAPSGGHALASNNVSDMAEDARGNLWVGTYGGGLHYYDAGRRRFTRIAAAHNLVEGVQLDNRGNVWMTGNGDLHRYDPARHAYTSFDLPDGEKTGGVRGRIFKDKKGRLYVGGTNFFISFHPDSISDTRLKPQVCFTEFEIFNKSFSHLLQQPSIRLHHGDNHFAFEFSAPDYASGSPVRYSYMLEGYEQAWTDAGERNYVSYSNLDGGTYRFRVRATNTPGIWNGKEASIQVVVVPPFWKRPIFYVACALVLLLLSYLVYRYRINELLRRQAIRNRIAQDLHDNVGSTLSSISVYSQVAKIYHEQHREAELDQALEKIGETSSEMITELSDTVWAINPRNDHMEVILQRMEGFARPLLAAQNIRFHFQYDPSLAVLNLEMGKRRNFYAIFKEAINNVVKYAGAGTVAVSIGHVGNKLRMQVRDDGKGFTLKKTGEGYKSTTVQGGGNGLRNMQLRALEMKGALKIDSSPETGTTIMLEFPIT